MPSTDQKLLNEAGEQLNFVAVFMREASVFFHEDFEDSEALEGLKMQSFKGVRSFVIKELDEVSGDGQSYLYDFEYRVGLRFADLSLEEDDDDFLKAEIAATFSARYSSISELSKECVLEFSKHNVGYHIWPFWREYVQSTCVRGGVNLISVPLYTDFQKKVLKDSEQS